MKQKKHSFGPILTPPAPYYGREKVEGFRNPYIPMYNAAARYNDYLMYNSNKKKILFIDSADSLADNLVVRRDFGVWLYYHLFSRAREYGCRIPWISALAQGLGISALVRAYDLVNKKKFLVTAKRALGAFHVPMANGGVLFVDNDDGDWWYEEYASAGSKPSGVLNGFILALLGIYDFHLISGDTISERLFERGISSLCHHLDDFDTNNPVKLTYYDRLKHIVTMDYHVLHIKLMEKMYEITEEEIFRKYWKKWEGYKRQWERNPMNRFVSRLYYVRSGYSLSQSTRLLFRALYDFSVAYKKERAKS